MKKILIWMLALSMLLLCGCEGINMGGTTAPTQPVVLEDPAKREAEGLVLRISINPEFEMTLSLANSILSVKPLNEDAETLFEDLDVVGMGYSAAIGMILEEAETKDFLDDGATVKITVTEEGYGSWTAISKTAITKPIEKFRQDAAATFNIKLDPAGKGVDVNGLMKCEEKNELYHMVYYVDYRGATVWSYTTYTNGSYTECYYPNDREIIYYNIEANGAVYYFHKTGCTSVGYTIHPDGHLREFIEYYDARNNLICSMNTDATGWVQDITYENNRMVSAVSRWPNGASEETTYSYYPNGAQSTCKTVWNNGDYQESFYDEDGKETKYVAQINGIYSEGIMGEDGYVACVHYWEGEGIESFCYYEGGVAVRWETFWPNGDYVIESFSPTGLQQSYIAQRDGSYREEYFDAEGMATSMYLVEPDGTERLWVIENGYGVSCTITEPDGTTYTEYYNYD